LIDSGASDAATNMATDEALLLSYRPGTSMPVLRLYGWRPAAFSIGLSQNPRHLLKTDAFVRRPTGGGLLFHDQELTYSFVASAQDIGVSLGVKESFAHITGFILELYRALGLKAHFAKNTKRLLTRSPLIAALCLSRQEAYDIIVNGKKIGGHAQKRVRHLILQHGTIPLFLHPEHFMKDLRDDSRQDLSGAASLYEVMHRRIFLRDIKNIGCQVFCRHFGVTLHVTDLTPQEARMMKQLRHEKYATPAWNNDRKTSFHGHRTPA
jgi:lipoate-protein ligase A